MNWNLIRFVNAKAHVVSDELITPLVQDMAKRGCPIDVEYSIDLTKSWFYDYGGMVRTTWRREWMKHDGLAVGTYSIWLDSQLSDLQDLWTKPRSFDWNGETYFKLHSHYSCLVLSPDQLKWLSRVFVWRLPIALKRAARDDADMKRDFPRQDRALQ